MLLSPPAAITSATRAPSPPWKNGAPRRPSASPQTAARSPLASLEFLAFATPQKIARQALAPDSFAPLQLSLPPPCSTASLIPLPQRESKKFSSLRQRKPLLRQRQNQRQLQSRGQWQRPWRRRIKRTGHIRILRHTPLRNRRHN